MMYNDSAEVGQVAQSLSNYIPYCPEKNGSQSYPPAKIQDSDKTEDFVYFTLNGVVLSIVIVLGIIGNLVIVLTLTVGRLKAKINIYLLVQAFWDTVLLVTSWMVFVQPALGIGPGRHFGTKSAKYVCWAASLAAHASRTGGRWVQTATSYERYEAFCRPLKHLRAGRAKPVAIIMTVSVCAVAFNIVRGFETEVRELPLCYDSKIGSWRVVYYIGSTLLRNDKKYVLIYKAIFSSALENIGPFLIQSIFTILILRAFRASTRLLSAMKNPGRKSSSSFEHQLIQQMKADRRSSNERVHTSHMANWSMADNAEATGSSEWSKCTQYNTSSEFKPYVIKKSTKSKSTPAGWSKIQDRRKSGRNGWKRSGKSGKPRRSGSDKSAFDKERIRNEALMTRMFIVIEAKCLVCAILPTVLDIIEVTASAKLFRSSLTLRTVVAISNSLVIVNAAANIFIYLACCGRFRRELVGLATRRFRRQQPSLKRPHSRSFNSGPAPNVVFQTAPLVRKSISSQGAVLAARRETDPRRSISAQFNTSTGKCGIEVHSK